MRLMQGTRSRTLNIVRASPWGMIRGLMCTRSSHVPLYFSLSFPFSIHSFFVFYPFFAVWIGKKNRVIRTDVVYPFQLRVSPPVGTTGLLEIPLHKKYASLGAFLVGKQRFDMLLSSRRTNI